MIDHFTILLTHGLMLLAGWRLLRRPDLDHEGPPPPRGLAQKDSARGFTRKGGRDV